MNQTVTRTTMLGYSTVALCLLLSLSGPATAQEPGKFSLSLKEAIRLAAERNLDVRAELYNPAVAEADIRKYRAIYDPNLTAQTNYGENSYTNQSFSGIITTQKSFNLNTGLNTLIPWGGTVGLVFNNGWTRTESIDRTSENFQNQLSVNITQPLLKNFGRETTELNISIATFNKEASLSQFQTKLTGVITQVRTEYFKLYYLREDLEVKKTSLALAQKILEETKARVKAGVLPAMEILNADFNVSTREKELIDAERMLSDERDLLRTLLQITDAGAIDPVDSPITASYQITEPEAVKHALEVRPELKQLRESTKSADLQERVSRNQTLPDLSLVANGGLQGINKDYSQQWESMGRGDYPVWQVGVTFSYPLGNNAAENDYIKNRLKTEQLRTQVRNLEESIANEVRTAIRSVRSSFKQLDVTNRGAAYAEEVLNAYIKKAQVGLATTKDVFDVQNNLVAAKGAQNQAKTAYDNALTLYWKSTGELLKREGISINGKEADALYGKMK